MANIARQCTRLHKESAGKYYADNSPLFGRLSFAELSGLLNHNGGHGFTIKMGKFSLFSASHSPIANEEDRMQVGFREKCK